jgi:PAS domain S-box-containing protein
LKEEEERYRNIFEAVSDALLIADTQTGMLVEMNPAACRMTGYNRFHLKI